MISVESVTKRFGNLTAVDNLSFHVDRREVVGFLGPNGAGKTTTMRMLTGTLEPDEGSVLFEGSPIDADLREAKSRVGYLPESNPLYEEMYASEYLEYVAEIRGMEFSETQEAISDAVEETGISEVFFRPISELSKGYRQRLGLAGAILHRPEILILDEPTEGWIPTRGSRYGDWSRSWGRSERFFSAPTSCRRWRLPAPVWSFSAGGGWWPKEASRSCWRPVPAGPAMWWRRRGRGSRRPWRHFRE